MKQFFSIPFLLLYVSTGVVADDSVLNEATYTLVSGTGTTPKANIAEGTNGSEGILIDGIKVKVSVSAWSDTGSHGLEYDFDNTRWDEGTEDETVQEARLSTHVNCTGNNNGGCVAGTEAYGYGIKNQDRVHYYNQHGDYVPWGDSHSIDNFNSDEGTTDFDMILLSFDTEVVLTGGTFSANYYDYGKTNDVTVVGLRSNELFTNGDDFTWSDVNDTVMAGALGHFDISETKNANNYYESSFSKSLTAARYWLVGAYNTVFDQGGSGSMNKVGFKLSSLNIEVKGPSVVGPPTEVSEPGALALMSLGLGLVLYRRKRRA